MRAQPIRHNLVRDDDGTYSFAAGGLSRGELLEFLVTLRRLELYRTVEIDSDVVEKAMRTMASFSARVPE